MGRANQDEPISLVLGISFVFPPHISKVNG
jgi:hypothetical protein